MGEILMNAVAFIIAYLSLGASISMIIGYYLCISRKEKIVNDNNVVWYAIGSMIFWPIAVPLVLRLYFKDKKSGVK